MNYKITALVLVLAFLASGLFAQEFGLKGIGIKAGYLDPGDVESTIGFGAVVNVGTIMPALGLDVNADYWSKSVGGADFRDIAIGASVKYAIMPGAKAIKPFALAGAGLHMLKSTVEFTNPFTGTSMKSEGSDSKFGIDLGAGLTYDISPKMAALVDVRYRLVSDFNQLYIAGGLMINL